MAEKMRCPWCKEIHGPHEQCHQPNQDELDLQYDEQIADYTSRNEDDHFYYD